MVLNEEDILVCSIRASASVCVWGIFGVLSNA